MPSAGGLASVLSVSEQLRKILGALVAAVVVGLLVACAAPAEKSATLPEPEQKKLPAPEWARGLWQQTSTEAGKTSYRVGLLWKKIPDMVTYKVYRSTVPGKDYTLIFTTQEDFSVDDTVELGKTYCYMVTALDNFSRESGYSQEQSITIQLQKKEEPKAKKRLMVIPRPTTRLWQVFDKRNEKDEGGQDTLLGDAYDLAYDRQADLLYVSSTFNRRIVVLRGSDGAVLRQFGPRLGDYELGVPLGLGLDEVGHLYVVDGKRNSIVVLTRDGGLIRVITVARQTGEKEQRLIDVAVLPGGTLFVTDNANGRVIAFDGGGREGRRGGEMGVGDEQLAGITKIAATVDGDLVVIDGQSKKIHLVSPSGNPHVSFGEKKPTVDGFIFLSDVAPLDDGHLLAADLGPSSVREYTLRKDPGMYVATLANSEGVREMSVINPLAISGDGKDLLFVLDSWGGRVSAFRLGNIRGSQ